MDISAFDGKGKNCSFPDLHPRQSFLWFSRVPREYPRGFFRPYLYDPPKNWRVLSNFKPHLGAIPILWSSDRLRSFDRIKGKFSPKLNCPPFLSKEVWMLPQSREKGRGKIGREKKRVREKIPFSLDKPTKKVLRSSPPNRRWAPTVE